MSAPNQECRANDPGATDADGLLHGTGTRSINTTDLRTCSSSRPRPATRYYAFAGHRLRSSGRAHQSVRTTPMRAPVEARALGRWRAPWTSSPTRSASTRSPTPGQLCRCRASRWRALVEQWLADAYAEGAGRNVRMAQTTERPRQDGVFLIGRGMATSTIFTPASPVPRAYVCAATAVVVERTPTISAPVTRPCLPVAAEALGIPRQVHIRWGDTNLPLTGPVYGSAHHGNGRCTRGGCARRAKLAIRPGGDLARRARCRRLEEVDGEGKFTLGAGELQHHNGAGRRTRCRPGARPSRRSGWTATSASSVSGARSRVYSAGRIINPSRRRAR